MGRRHLPLAIFFSLLAAKTSAFTLCGASGNELAEHLAGEWQLETVTSQVSVGDVIVDGPAGNRETVILDLDASGVGTFVVKGRPVPMRLHPLGTFELLEMPDHFKAFSLAVIHLDKTNATLIKDCDIRRLPKFSAQKLVMLNGLSADSTTELVGLGENLFAGAQVVIMSNAGAPETKIVSALIMRQDPVENNE